MEGSNGLLKISFFSTGLVTAFLGLPWSSSIHISITIFLYCCCSSNNTSDHILGCEECSLGISVTSLLRDLLLGTVSVTPRAPYLPFTTSVSPFPDVSVPALPPACTGLSFFFRGRPSDYWGCFSQKPRELVVPGNHPSRTALSQ